MARPSISITGKLLSIAVCLSLAAPAWGVITHSGSTAPTDKPDDSVVGRWDVSATNNHTGTCVAIDTDWVITTGHQGGSVGDKVIMGGVEYEIGQIIKHSTADMSLAWIKKDGQFADLQHHAELYTGSNESGKYMLIGGYGMVSGATLNNGSVDYGYEWTSAPKTAPVWGTNYVNQPVSFGGVDYLKADFDENPTYIPGDHNCEASIANKDSGSAWLIEQGGQWRLAGLGQSVTGHYESGHEGDEDYRLYETWFRNPVTGRLAPDELYGIQVKSYVSWIQAKQADWKLPGDANEDGMVTDADYTIWADNFGASGATWSMGDFNGSGTVNNADYNIWLSNYGYGVSGPLGPPPLAPEPASASVMLVGTAVLMFTKNRRRQTD